MIGAIFDSCPGPLSTLPYTAQRFGITNTHDIPVFFPFLLLPGVYGYFHYTFAQTSISQSIMKSIGKSTFTIKSNRKMALTKTSKIKSILSILVAQIDI